MTKLYEDNIEVLFTKLLEYDVKSREAALGKLAAEKPTLHAELVSLLNAADKANGFLSLSPVHTPSAPAPDPHEWVAQCIGSYRIIRELGRGGMGTVFLAERDDGEYFQEVAIKLVTSVMNTDLTLRRFKAERQILANLEHPYIARLLDGGTTVDGHPYLVMENIQGEPIDCYCRSRQLSIKEKLDLFIKVCDAVHHAHQNLIVHRDLKPDNILITADGIPKLLDFGIAKLLGAANVRSENGPNTLAGMSVMTPEYASPEQVIGESITTATDVYSLGIVLFELLTGRRPYEFLSGNINSIAQTICETQAPRPSCLTPELCSELRGDLDSITLFALRKDPKLRYQSAQHLASDLQQHLVGQPVSVIRGSFGYRVTKFVKRNIVGVGLGASVLVTLLTGIIVTSWQWQMTQVQHTRAERSDDEVRDLAKTIVFPLSDLVEEVPASTRLRKSLLDKGLTSLERLGQARGKDIELQREIATAYFKLASVEGNPLQENLGNQSDSRELYKKALAIRETLVANDPTSLQASLDLAQTYKWLSAVYGASGELDQALNHATRCIPLLQKHLPGGKRKVRNLLVGCYTAAAHWESARGNFMEAKQYLLNARKTIGRAFYAEPKTLPALLRIHIGRIHEEWAEVAAKTGDPARAVRSERKRLAALLTLPDDHRKPRRLADAYQGLAARFAAAGNTNEALQAFQHALTLWAKRAKAYPEDVRPKQGMAGVYAELSKLHSILATQSDEPDETRRHWQKACGFFQHSRRLVGMLPKSGPGFGIRYSWLQSPAKVMRQLAAQCR